MNDLISQIVKTALEIATPVLAALVTALLVKALQKAGLSVDADRQAKLEYFAAQAINAAEEYGATRVKVNLPVTAKDKLEHAIATLTEKVPGVTPDEAAALIHATLPKVGAGAAAVAKDFLQGLASAATTGAK